MIWRPQFIYPRTPKGYRDDTFTYTFDASNVVALSGTIGAGQTITEIPLQLEADAPFLWRGWKLDAQQDNLSLQFVFRTPDGYFLAPSNTFLPIQLCGVPAGYITPVGGSVVPMECDIYCPASAVIGLYLHNPTAAPVDYNLPVLLFGEKRRLEGCC